MKKLVLFFCLGVILFASGVDWSHDYKAALKQANVKNKPVYVLLVSERCRWCRKFEETTLQDADVKKRLAKDFIVVTLVREKDYVPPYFETKPVPRHYFVDKDGNILYESLGHRDVTTFEKFMDEVQLDMKEK